MSFWENFLNPAQTQAPFNWSTTNILDAFRNFSTADNSSDLSLEDLLTSLLDKNEDKTFLQPYHPFNPRVKISLICMYALVIFFSLVGNGLVCYIVVRRKHMRTVTNFFLASQSFSDIILTIFNAPFLLVRNITRGWLFGDVMCHTVDYSMNVSIYVSTLTLTAIAIDRHQVLLHPLRPRITMSTAVCALLSIWIGAILLPMPMAIFRSLEFFASLGVYACIPSPPSWDFARNFQFTTIIFQYLLPMVVITTAYIRIARRLWSRTAVSDFVTAEQQNMQDRTKRRMIKMLVVVVVIFAICWLPINVYLLMYWYHPAFQHDSLVYIICHWVAMTSVCLNPVVYCWMNEKFRNEFKAILKLKTNKVLSSSSGVQANCAKPNVNMISAVKLDQDLGFKLGESSGISISIPSTKATSIAPFERQQERTTTSCSAPPSSAYVVANEPDDEYEVFDDEKVLNRFDSKLRWKENPMDSSRPGHYFVSETDLSSSPHGSMSDEFVFHNLLQSERAPMSYTLQTVQPNTGDAEQPTLTSQSTSSKKTPAPDSMVSSNHQYPTQTNLPPPHRSLPPSSPPPRSLGRFAASPVSSIRSALTSPEVSAQCTPPPSRRTSETAWHSLNPSHRNFHQQLPPVRPPLPSTVTWRGSAELVKQDVFERILSQKSKKPPAPQPPPRGLKRVKRTNYRVSKYQADDRV
ncbi:neuropeptide FF receptor 2-like [Ptychodera flava]|uniref:neuropeptide FF receptor 2-like n=1 Tax=Ptychodera flava TaxID=63121 RepID=UPI003969E371